MTKIVYGFKEPDIEKLAESLSTIIGIRLHALQSPMIGPWYSSQDALAIVEAVRSGNQEMVQALVAASEREPQITLMLNDNGDAYYGGAEFPGQSACLLRVEANSDLLRELEGKLRSSGLSYKELSRSE